MSMRRQFSNFGNRNQAFEALSVCSSRSHAVFVLSVRVPSVCVLMPVLCLSDLGKSAKGYIHTRVGMGIQIHAYTPKFGNQMSFRSGKDDE